MPKIELMQGDCLEKMKGIPDGSIDCVITDPPYGITTCKWDSVIPLEPMWEQLKRVIKPNGAIVMMASQPFTTTLIASNMKMFKYCWVWIKSRASGFAQAKNMPLKNIEDIIVFSGGVTCHKSQVGSRRVPYNPQGIEYKPRLISQMKNNPTSLSFCKRNNKEFEPYTQEYTNYPKQTLQFSIEKGFHPAQKPVALMKYLIKTYTNEGETVLDFTMGSGTTGVAAKNLNRNFIGIELNAKYFEIAKQRINEESIKLQMEFE